jgi:small-conductance mechanosensitive channel
VEVRLGISYESDLEKAIALVLEAAKEHPKCMETPEPACFVREFADSSINMVLFFWVADVTEGRFGPQSDVMRSILKKFKANHVDIPFPQRDVHIRHTDMARPPLQMQTGDTSRAADETDGAS